MSRPIRIPSRYAAAHPRREDSCREMLLRLQTVDFAITDTQLYLDAYPEERRAREYQSRLLLERAELLALMERAGCPPVTPGVDGNGEFHWVDTPWPWEPEES